MAQGRNLVGIQNSPAVEDTSGDTFFDKEWPETRFLKDLQYSSDFEGDTAYYWPADYPVPAELLCQIRFEWKYSGTEWKTFSLFDSQFVGISFPQATGEFIKPKVGFYTPYLNGMRGTEHPILRATIPRALLEC